MIVGLGNDIIEVSRIKRLIDQYGPRFKERLFTPDEIAYCELYADEEVRFAGRFAAKEAIAKALGTGFRGVVTWHGIQILTNSLGKPEVRLSESILELVGPIQIQLSISHCKEYATAVAIATK